MDMTTFEKLCQLAYERKASDLHLLSGEIPKIRDSSGALCDLKTVPALPFPRKCPTIDEDILLTDGILDEAEYNALTRKGSIDIGKSIPYQEKEFRVRINIFQSFHGIGIAVRLLPDTIPAMAQLHLPTVVQALTDKKYGLVLFTAPTGNGKSTSIASILEHVNETQAKRIITIEDPIEYTMESKSSLISQREIGTHCASFADGLKDALREDPDIILVGELRDRETIFTALAAAETGHLVFSTLHAGNVVQAIDRLMQYFPAQEQEQIQAEIANSFRAIIAQKLIPRKDKEGRIAAFEVLLRTEATTNVIRTGKAFSLPSYMTLRDKMQTMDDSIAHLRESGWIE